MIRPLHFLPLPFLLATPAEAYIGPGAGLGAVGLLIALVVGTLLLVLGFIWYPVKRMFRRRSKKPPKTKETDA